MRKHLLAAAVLVAVPGLAMAADLGRPAPAPVYTKAPPLMPACIWCGFYIGADVGGYWARQTATTTPFPSPGFGAPAIGGGGIAGFGNLPTAHNLNRNGIIGGGYVGYNWQWSNFVAGLEADVSALGRNTASDTETVFATFGAAPAAAFTMTVTASNTWLATARARAGIAWNQTLLYVTGGGAWTTTSYSATAIGLNNPGGGITLAGSGAAVSWSDNRTGFVVGGGLEWAVTQNWLLRGEYLYHEFSASSAVMPLIVAPGTGGNTCAGNCNWLISPSKLQLHVARAGLSYKF